MQSSVKPVLLLVLAVAAAINTISFFGSQLWVAPDTSYYVELAGGIAERGDFSNELFLIRPLGYPLMLAAIFLLFGGASAIVILVVQHAMVVATALIVALLAWQLTQSRVAAAASGLMAACSLQLLAFANVIMTEVPYALVLVVSVYSLVRFQLTGRGRWLAVASMMAGVGYLFRPIGMTAVAACALAALLHVWRPRRAAFGAALPNATTPRLPRLQTWSKGAAVFAMAVAPAFIVTVPGMIQNKLNHGGDLSAQCANLAIYYRAVCMDKLDSRHSPALDDVRNTVHEAVALGHLPPHVDHTQWGHVWKAYESVHGMKLSEASMVMGQAARDLIREHRGATMKRTVKYVYWMLMVPDSFYRFHPGGARGLFNEQGDSIRDPAAEIFSTATYEPMLRRWTGPYESYLHLQSGAATGPISDVGLDTGTPGQRPVQTGGAGVGDAGLTRAMPAGPLWTAINRWFYRNIEKGPAVGGPVDSPYEAFTWICLLCAAGSLLTRNRGAWFLIIAVIALQIGISAILAGPTPRYAVPVKPLLVLFPALAIAAVTALRITRPVQSIHHVALPAA